LIRRADPTAEVTVFERNRADDTFGFGVVFSDRTLDGIHRADPALRQALAEHGRHWDAIETRLKGERIRCGGRHHLHQLAEVRSSVRCAWAQSVKLRAGRLVTAVMSPVGSECVRRPIWCR
jgi:hypothetical protein